MNQLDSIFQRLAEEEAARRVRRKLRRVELTPQKRHNGRGKLHPVESREFYIKQLMARSHTDEFGCRIWDGLKDSNGYGRFQFANQTLAHRISFLLMRGELNGLHACHKCDVPSCINPDHLFPGTDADNQADMVKKGRRPVGGRAKLTIDNVREIRRLYETSPRQNWKQIKARLAASFGVTPWTIYEVTSGRRWTKEVHQWVIP